MRINHLKSVQTDPTLREQGVWHDIAVPGSSEPLRLKLRSLSSNAARMWDRVRVRENRRYYEDDQVPPIEVQDQNECDKLAEVMVLDWNITEADGVTVVPCTKEAIRELMKQLPDVRFDAFRQSNRKEAYRLAEVKAIEKNSGAPSTSISATGVAAE